jgi:beta-mannosidase
VLHYMARNVYQPVIISPFFGNGTLQIWATSDLLAPVTGTAKWTWYSWTGSQLASTVSTNFTIGPVNSTLVHAAGNGTAVPVIPGNATAENAVLYLTLTASDGGKDYTHENWFSPAYLNVANLTDPKIELTVTYPSSSGSAAAPTFTVSARAGVAAWVFLEHPEGVLGWFSENAFLLIPGQDRQITFEVWPESDTTNGGWVDGVTVRSMWNNTIV